MRTEIRAVGVMLAILMLIGMPGTSLAQARRSAGPAGGAPGGAVPDVLKKGLKISFDQVLTPEYSVNSSEQKSTTRQNWGMVSVQYETLPEWLDELEFRYYVVVQDKKTERYTLFPLTVVYSDIAKGRHQATVFLRPSTVARHGAITRAAVEVMFRGGVIARESIPPSDQRWWESPNVARVEGVLMGRSQTPFSLISWDNHEAERVVPAR